MIRSTILTACALGCFAVAQAQPLNVHQQKQPTATTTTQETASKAETKAPAPQMAELMIQGKVHCPAGVHYFVGYDPCIPPSPWEQQPQQR